MMEYEQESITGANNVTSDAFSHTFSSQKENADTVFTSEKLNKLDKIVNAINNLTINYTLYELNTEAASDAQGDLTNDPYTVTHTSNRILDQELLS